MSENAMIISEENQLYSEILSLGSVYALCEHQLLPITIRDRVSLRKMVYNSWTRVEHVYFVLKYLP